MKQKQMGQLQSIINEVIKKSEARQAIDDIARAKKQLIKHDATTEVKAGENSNGSQNSYQ